MSELPQGVRPAEPSVPRDSASGIVLRPSPQGTWEVLLGRRSRDSSFMPGHLVFPGGTFEIADRPEEPGVPSRCASRELLEESGLSIEPECWLDAGERTTPPLFPVRFRNRFLLAPAPPSWSLPEVPPSPEEIEALRFADPGAVIQEWSSGTARVPPPALPILRVLATQVAGSPPTEIARRIGEANAVEELAPRIEFIPDVWMLPVRSATLPPATHTNVWMPGGSRFAIIDPGARDDREIQRLLQVVERRRRLGHEPYAVILTHGHRDHTSGASTLATSLRVPLLGHPATLNRVAVERSVAVRALDDGEDLDLQGLTLRARFTPGHHPGHLAFEILKRRALIAGDLISGVSTILVEPGEGDMESYLDSLIRMDALGCATLFPGHGPPLPGRALRRLIDHRARREARILDQLADGPQDVATIARGVYADVPDMPAALTERQTLAHLMRLGKLGRVRSQDSQRSWAIGE